MSRLRLAGPVALAVALAVTVGACGSSGGVAASVGEHRITHGDVVDELEAIRANERYVEALEGSGRSVLGSSEDAFDADFVATQLALRIQYALVGNEVDRRGVAPDQACRDAAEQALAQNLSTAGGEGSLLDGFPAHYRTYLVDREADVLALLGDAVGLRCLSEEEAEGFFDEHRRDFEQACSSHVLVDTAEEAEEVVELLRSGADFAAVAAERSTDPGSAADGGSLGCQPRGVFVAPFEEAVFSQPIGEVGEPVETSFGFHVIRVDERRVPSFEEVAGEVRQVLASQASAELTGWLTRAAGEVDVAVDPRYGRWDPDSLSVVRSGASRAPEAGEPPAGG